MVDPIHIFESLITKYSNIFRLFECLVTREQHYLEELEGLGGMVLLDVSLRVVFRLSKARATSSVSVLAY